MHPSMRAQPVGVPVGRLCAYPCLAHRTLQCLKTPLYPSNSPSLHQVHRATLHSGEQVVVKVQRPGLRQLFEIDLQVCAACLVLICGLN